MRAHSQLSERGPVPRILPSLTSLRFFAAFGVVLYHLSLRLPPPTGRRLVEHAFFGGASGVSFFFVLSGFVLTWGRDGVDGRPRDFYQRRFARIYPNHVLTLFFSIAILYGHHHVFPAKSTLLTALLVQSWVPDLRVALAAIP